MAACLGKSSTMAAAFITGVLSLILHSIAMGTDFWVSSTYSLSKNRDEFNTTEVGDIAEVLQNAGLWRECISQTNLTFDDSIHFICRNNNFTVAGETGYDQVVYYTALAAATCACLCLILQVFGALSGVQAAWQIKSSLFTDCGLMFLFAAICDTLTVSLYLVSKLYFVNERPTSLVKFPDGFEKTVNFSWSFYCCFLGFVCCSFSGTVYLLIARYWRKQEIYHPPDDIAREKKVSVSYRKSIISIPKL